MYRQGASIWKRIAKIDSAVRADWLPTYIGLCFKYMDHYKCFEFGQACSSYVASLRTVDEKFLCMFVRLLWVRFGKGARCTCTKFEIIKTDINYYHTEQYKKHGIFITSVSRGLIGPLWIVKLNLVDNPWQHHQRASFQTLFLDAWKIHCLLRDVCALQIGGHY